MNQVRIGKFIAKCRKEKKLTQQELANKLGVTDKAISKWENGRCMMDIALLKPLSEELDVSIIEIINGEKIDEKDISNKSHEVVEKTLLYANKKIKKSRIKHILFSCFIMILIFSISFCSYKGVLLYLYGNVNDDRFDGIVKYLKNSDNINIYKRTINEDEYLVLDDIKIRNDFKEFEVEESDNKLIPHIYRLKNDSGEVVSSVTISKFDSLINIFVEDAYVMGDMDSKVVDFGQFNSADRSYFLLRNDINDDTDFFKFIEKNGYLESGIFTSQREIKENYAYNLFVSIVIPEVDNISYINGDYNGYIYTINKNDKCIRQVTIYRNDYCYNFLITGEDYTDIDYIVDLFSTLEIK